MKEQDKQAPVVHNTFNAPIGQYVQYQHIEHMTIGSDGQIHIASSSQPTPQPAPTQVAAATIDPAPLIFLPNEQNREAIIALLKSTLSISPKSPLYVRNSSNSAHFLTSITLMILPRQISLTRG